MTDADALRAHLAVDEDERGAKWCHRFYDLAETARLNRRDPPIFAIAGLTWFLPRHLVVSILPTDVIDALDEAFVPLAA